MFKRTSFLIASAIGLLASARAEAGCTDGTLGIRHNVQLCFVYETAFSDEGAGEDLWSNDAVTKTARGVRVQLIRSGGSFVEWGGTSGTYTDPDTGCTPVITIYGNGMFHTGPWIVRVFSQAQVNGASSVNTIDLRRSSDGNRYYKDLQIGGADYNPTSNTVCTFTWKDSDSVKVEATGTPSYTGHVVDYAAAVGYSLDQAPGGLSGKTIKAYIGGCPSDSGACPGPTGGNCACEDTTSAAKVYMKDSSTPDTSYKFVISHEVGHAVSILANGGQRAAKEPGGAPGSDPCDTDGYGSHTLVSREYQGTAAYEGLANFYSAAVWNNQGNASRKPDRV